MLHRFSREIPFQVAIACGMICLTLSHLIERFLPKTGGADFLVGMFLGLSLTMYLWGLLRFRVERIRSGR